MTDTPPEPRGPEEGMDPQLARVVARLTSERPLPRPAYRGALRRSLVSEPNRPSPRRARMLVFAYSASGVALLAITVVGLVGVGPLATG